MKVLGIVCSPRKNSNTEVLIKEVLNSAQAHGAETDMILISEFNILPCDGCDACFSSGKCKINDDMQGIYPRLLEADGIIVGSPVYYWSVTAQAKLLIDRTYAFRRERQLRNKVAGAVLVARGLGVSSAFDTLCHFFNAHRMILASGIGPRSADELAIERTGMAFAYANRRGEVAKNTHAIAQAQALGRSVVETIGNLSNAKRL